MDMSLLRKYATMQQTLWCLIAFYKSLYRSFTTSGRLASMNRLCNWFACIVFR